MPHTVSTKEIAELLDGTLPRERRAEVCLALAHDDEAYEVFTDTVEIIVALDEEDRLTARRRIRRLLNLPEEG
jgi:anti-sigma factor RsiW